MGSTNMTRDEVEVLLVKYTESLRYGPSSGVTLTTKTSGSLHSGTMLPTYNCYSLNIANDGRTNLPSELISAFFWFTVYTGHAVTLPAHEIIGVRNSSGENIAMGYRAISNHFVNKYFTGRAHLKSVFKVELKDIRLSDMVISLILHEGKIACVISDNNPNPVKVKGTVTDQGFTPFVPPPPTGCKLTEINSPPFLVKP